MGGAEHGANTVSEDEDGPADMDVDASGHHSSRATPSYTEEGASAGARALFAPATLRTGRAFSGMHQDTVEGRGMASCH